jgi:hypothetical protein
MKIIVEIEELILHGIAPETAASVGDALRGELATLLAVRGIPRSLARDATASAIDGGAVHLREGAPAERIGRQLASAVYGSLEGA